MDNNIDNLISDYEKQQKRHPFLLIDLSGGKENTHTNVLMSLLQFNDFMFLQSFLTEVLSVPKWDGDKTTVEISNQKKAIGPKKEKETNGFIDLYIKYNDEDSEEHIIVIENKINGASDTERQMLRYIATVKNTAIDDSEAFEQWVKQIKDDTNIESIKIDCINRHFVYLTLDNSKAPENDSLPTFLYDERRIIDYYPICYQNDLLPWLKDTVLRYCPYYDNGIVVAGIRQYIASLEGLSSRNITVSDRVKQFVDDLVKNNDNDICRSYKKINDTIIPSLKTEIENLDDNNKIDSRKRLAREFEVAAEGLITKGIIPDGWALHFSPTLLVLYKPEWMNISRGTYSIPFVNIYANPNSFLNGKSISWQLHIEHFSPERCSPPQNFTSINHERTAVYCLNKTNNGYETTVDGRKQCINDVISNNKEIIELIDASVASINSQKMNMNNDKDIRIALFDLLIKKLQYYRQMELP